MPEIITEAQASSSTIRAHEFPALEEGNISFPNGRYIVDFEPRPDQRSFTVSHRVEGAQLITDLVVEGLATFVCMVSSPVSSYRDTHVSVPPTHVVSWEEGDLGEPPLFTPMVVACRTFERTLDKTQHGVHEVWHERHVRFATGMRLALGNIVQLRSSLLHMLSFHDEPSLGPGQFLVKAETQEGFSFRVETASDLHAFLRFGTEDPSRGHILTHVVSACFSLLKSDYADDDDEDGDWRSYRSLQALAHHLKSQDLPHWSDGPDFVPELVATRLYPHRIFPPTPEAESGH